jgi:hypothetical protein
MAHIPLAEFSRPRIMMLDFQPQDVERVRKAGFDARRGATGIYDNNEFHFPFAYQDVDILFAQVQDGSFTRENYNPSDNSVEKEAIFINLLRHTWEKAGVIVLFIEQETSPQELRAIGFNDIGIISLENQNITSKIGSMMNLESFRQTNYSLTSEYILPKESMPIFKGITVQTSEETENNIIQRYIKSNATKMSVLTCIPRRELRQRFDENSQIKLNFLRNDTLIYWLIKDNTADQNIIALKLRNIIYAKNLDESIRQEGSILLLPDFGPNNIKVALELLQEVFTESSPHLFDNPQHPWLEDYQPYPIKQLQQQQQDIIDEAQQKFDQIKEQIELEQDKYAWLPGLLVLKNEEFEDAVAQALRFLGFDVTEVDKTLAAKERKREDFHISDPSNNYFAIGEAKSTGGGRGASEEFIEKTRKHQIRYGREYNQVPSALLIINFAITLEPQQRVNLFYKEDISEELEDSYITALSSVALFELCQYVLSEQMTKDQARQHITSGQAIISTIQSISAS